MADADARRGAEEALAFMDAALRDEMPPLPTQVKALADSVRALLAAGPETPPSDAVREAAACTGVAAVWCPVHGNCNCPRTEHGERVDEKEYCPLHGRSSTHAEAEIAALSSSAAPPSDAVREAAEVVRTILTAHDARLSESGVLTYGPPSKGTGFVAAIQWLRRYDAARGGE